MGFLGTFSMSFCIVFGHYCKKNQFVTNLLNVEPNGPDVICHSYFRCTPVNRSWAMTNTKTTTTTTTAATTTTATTTTTPMMIT